MDEPLAFDVDLARGLVENQDFCVSQKCAGQGNPLALATADSLTVWTDDSMIAARKRRDECIGPGHASSGDDLCFRRVPATIANVVQDRFVEQLGLLRHECNA